jgi:hypothetical protein
MYQTFSEIKKVLAKDAESAKEERFLAALEMTGTAFAQNNKDMSFRRTQ